MYADVRRACEQCSHCALANATKHTIEWTTLPCDIPFDIFLPTSGLLAQSLAATKIARASLPWKACLVSVLAPRPPSFTPSLSHSQCINTFLPIFHPHLLVVDTGSEFCATLRIVAALLFINIIMLPPKSHHFQRFERFHRFINKVVLLARSRNGLQLTPLSIMLGTRYKWT
jgi:hypothetical protein